MFESAAVLYDAAVFMPERNASIPSCFYYIIFLSKPKQIAYAFPAPSFQGKGKPRETDRTAFCEVIKIAFFIICLTVR